MTSFFVRRESILRPHILIDLRSKRERAREDSTVRRVPLADGELFFFSDQSKNDTSRRLYVNVIAPVESSCRQSRRRVRINVCVRVVRAAEIARAGRRTITKLL